MIVYSNRFKKQCVIQRNYFDKDVAFKEKLFLLAHVLNKDNVSSKKLKNNNCQYFFRTYNYGKGIIFEGMLFSSVDSYFKKRRMKENIKLFKKIYQKGFFRDAPFLSFKKKQLTEEIEENRKDSYIVLKSKMLLPYSAIDIDLNALNNISIEDLYQILPKIYSNKRKDYIYLGDIFKRENFKKDSFFQDSLDDIPVDYSQTNEIIYSQSIKNETMISTYSFKKIKTVFDFYLTYASLQAIVYYFLALQDILSIQCHPIIDIISECKAVICFIYDKNMLYNNVERIFFTYSTLKEDIPIEYVRQAIRKIKLDLISVNNDLSIAINRMLVLKDLKILDSSVFDDFSINENQIREKLSEIKKVDVFSMMKGKK